MKTFIITMILIIGLTGCTQEADTTSADNGLIEAPVVDKTLSASDVAIESSYSFAYNDAPIENYDTFKSGDEIVITNNDNLQLEVYGSNQPIDTKSNVDLVTSSSENEISLEGNYVYYRIDAETAGDIVISVI